MDKLKGLPVYNISIDEFSDIQGITIMSIVDKPAIESNFLKFSKAQARYSFNEDKRIITGCAIRANYPILREDENGYFYVTFNEEAIEKLVCKFMKEQKTNDVNIDHSKLVEGLYLFESFILRDELRINYPEFADIENGSWMVSYKVDNEEVWKSIKEGNLNGFSVEITTDLVDENSDLLEKILELLKQI